MACRASFWTENVIMFIIGSLHLKILFMTLFSVWSCSFSRAGRRVYANSFLAVCTDLKNYPPVLDIPGIRVLCCDDTDCPMFYVAHKNCPSTRCQKQQIRSAGTQTLFQTQLLLWNRLHNNWVRSSPCFCSGCLL